MLRISPLFLLMFSLIAQAQTQTMNHIDNKYFQITSFESTLTAQEASPDLPESAKSQLEIPMALLAETTNPELVTIEQIVNIGEKVLKIIGSGAPTSKIKTNIATAVPKGVTDWTQLQNWKGTYTQTYTVTAKNFYGMTVVSFDYRLVFIYGGDYQGRGRYIGYATIEPDNVHVMYGYNLDLEADVASVYNMGSSTDPLAAIRLVVTYKASTVFGIISKSDAFVLSGDGTLK